MNPLQNAYWLESIEEINTYVSIFPNVHSRNHRLREICWRFSVKTNVQTQKLYRTTQSQVIVEHVRVDFHSQNWNFNVNQINPQKYKHNKTTKNNIHNYLSFTCKRIQVSRFWFKQNRQIQCLNIESFCLLLLFSHKYTVVHTNSVRNNFNFLFSGRCNSVFNNQNMNEVTNVSIEFLTSRRLFRSKSSSFVGYES